MLYDSKNCEKGASTYPSKIQFVTECFMTQEMCDKAVNRCFFGFDSIPYNHKTQEMGDSVVFEDPFSIEYCPYKYKTQRISGKAVNDS